MQTAGLSGLTIGPVHQSPMVAMVVRRQAHALSRIITASILHFKVHTTYCLRLLTATGA